MEMIYCGRCGQELPKEAKFCKKCGAPVPQNNALPTPVSQETVIQGNQVVPVHEVVVNPDDKSKKLKTGLIAFLATLLVIGLAFLGYTTYRDKQERDLWATLQNSHDLTAIQAFVNDYPNGQFITEAQSRLAYVIEEAQQWNSISTTTDSVLLINFTTKYTEGNYHDLASKALDDLRANAYAQLHDPAYLESLMNQMASAHKSGDTKGLISRFGSDRLKSTYNKYAKGYKKRNEYGYDEYYGLYLLEVIFSDGYMTIKGNSVTDLTDNTGTLHFTTYYNGPEGVERYGTATFNIILERNQWRIDDIKMSDYKSSFMSNPQNYMGFLP